MQLHFLSGGRVRMQRHIYYPEAQEGETFELPVWCALIKHKQGNILFDTGCHPDAALDGNDRWGPISQRVQPIFQARDTLIHQLPLVNLSADDIDIVVCSHFHLDHCGCNGFFRRATVVCHADEIEWARKNEGRGYMPIDWDQPMPMQTVSTEHDLMGDGRMTLVPVPGHTPGMMAAHIALESGASFLLASDAVPVRPVLDKRYCPQNTWDKELCLQSLETIAGFERGGATVIYGHDDAQWHALQKGGNAYR